MLITIMNSGHSFDWQDDQALELSSELTPILDDMPVNERIAALAYQLAVAAAQMDMPDHECPDSVKADLLAELVRSYVTAGFIGLRKFEAERCRARHLRLVPG